MSAKGELEELIKKEIFNDYHALIADPLKSLVLKVAENLHYSFETSRGFNGRNGSFLFLSKEILDLFHNIGYAVKESPIPKWGKYYVGELTPEAKEMYQKLKEESNFKSSYIALIPEFKYE